MAKKLKAPKKAKAKFVEAPKRRNGSRIFDAKWKVSSDWTSTKGKHKDERVTKVQWRWFANRERTKGVKHDPYEVTKARSVSHTSDSFNVANFDYKGKSYNRQSFYPYTGTKLTDVVIQVRLGNEGGWGEWVSSDSVNFQKPAQPTIASMALNDQSGRVEFTITSDYGNGKKERAYTEWWVECYDSRTGKTVTVMGPYKSTNLSITNHYDVSDWQEIGYNDTITVTLYAINKGYAGDSGTKPVSKAVTLAYPGQATIKDIKLHGRTDPDKVTVYVSTGSTGTHPVTACYLQAIVDSDYATTDEIPADPNEEIWQPTGAQDDGSCEAFASTVGALRPVKGKHTWLRVKTVNLFEQPYRRYSEAKEVSELYQAMPTAADDRCGIIAATPAADGESADVTVGWTDVGGTNTGTELSWSNDHRAWMSTDPPNTYDFEWVDGDAPVGSGWTKAATIHLMGLDPAKTTYVRARRYLVNADDPSLVTYSPYCEMVAVMPTSGPTSVVMDASRYVPRGQGIEVRWGYDSDAEQVSWKVRQKVGQTRDEDADLTLALGDDQRTSVVIPTDSMTGGSVTLYVQVDAGGTLISSEGERVVYLNDPPTASVSVATLTAQPLEFDVTTNTSTASLTVVVTALGATASEFLPRQASGDTVWSEHYEEVPWEASGGSYTVRVTAPGGLDFRDGCDYSIDVRVTDLRTGLSAEAPQVTFDVAWEHQAPKPPDSITVTPSDVTDENGMRTISCTLAMAAPTGALGTEVYDVYRMTPDSQYEIATGVALSAVVIDRFAPFGADDLYYRVACRTVDGDMEYTDYPYILDTVGVTDPMRLRVDFGSDYVEFDRGVAPSNKWAKSFVQRPSLGGSMPGYWGPGVTRDMSASPVMVRIYERSQELAVRALGQYAGACLVRVSDGSAFCANVDVGLSTSVNSAGIVAQLTLREVELTREYRADVPGEVDEA